MTTDETIGVQPNSGGAFVAGKHADRSKRNLLRSQGKASGIALLWLAFYVVIVVAAVIHKPSPSVTANARGTVAETPDGPDR